MKRLELLQKSYKTHILGEYHFEELEELKSILKGKTIEQIRKDRTLITFNHSEEYTDIDYKDIICTIYTNNGKPYLCKYIDVYSNTPGYEDYDANIPLMEEDYFL